MGTIFISYRRDGSSYPSQLIATGLIQRFPDHEVFIDTDSIRAGKNIQQVIGKALKRADAMVAVIGPRWLTLTNKAGQLRLHQPDDWVVGEVRHSLNNRKPIIPITVDGTDPV